MGRCSDQRHPLPGSVHGQHGQSRRDDGGPGHGGDPLSRRPEMGDYLCFEEDCDENIVLRELLDKKLWQIPDRIRDKDAFEENINRALREHHPEYWRSRQQGLEREHTRSGPSRGAER